MTAGIYAITHVVSSRQYVGSTIDIRRRWFAHRWRLSRHQHPNPKLQATWLKYGEHAFTFEVLEIVNAVEAIADALAEREQHWCDLLHPAFNLRSIARSNLGMRFSDVTRIKMSQSHRSRLTQEVLERMREVNREINRRPEVRAKISRSLTGLKRSETHQARIREVLQSPERKQIVSAAHKGKPKPLAQRAKISAAQKGVPRPYASALHRGKHRSSVSREKMRQAALRRWAREREQAPKGGSNEELQALLDSGTLNSVERKRVYDRLRARKSLARKREQAQQTAP